MAKLYNPRCECTGFGIRFDESNANNDFRAGIPAVFKNTSWQSIELPQSWNFLLPLTHNKAAAHPGWNAKTSNWTAWMPIYGGLQTIGGEGGRKKQSANSRYKAQEKLWHLLNPWMALLKHLQALVHSCSSSVSHSLTGVEIHRSTYLGSPRNTPAASKRPIGLERVL